MQARVYTMYVCVSVCGMHGNIYGLCVLYTIYMSHATYMGFFYLSVHIYRESLTFLFVHML